MSKFKRDCMERWGGVNHDDLWKLFSLSVIDNVNGAHVIRFLKEEHKDLRFGDAGNVEVEYLVEVTFTNSYGAMDEIDHALESMNGRDWRMACDAICTRLLKRHDVNPDEFEWPCPDARVTYDWFEDEDDVTKTVTLVWQTDERTWRWMNPATVQEIRAEEGKGAPKSYMVTEWCPHCENENTMEWDPEKEGYVAFCAHCGKKMLLCDECTHADDNPTHDCNHKLCKKRKRTRKW